MLSGPNPSQAKLKPRKKLAATKPVAVAKSAEYFANNPPASQFTGQRPAPNNPILGRIMDEGRRFWSTRGVQLPENISLDVADDLREDPNGEPVLGRGWDTNQGGPRIAVDNSWLEGLLDIANNKRIATIQRRAALKRIASSLLHEQGHVGAVPHIEGEGFMRDGGAGDLVPQEMASLVRKLIRPSKKYRQGKRGLGAG